MSEPFFKRVSDKIFFFVAIAIFAALAAFVFLHDSPPAETVNPAKLAVSASVAPIESLVKEIGGDKVEVYLIVPEGQSPHTFEPMPDVVERISGTKAVFIVGVVDEWIAPLAKVLGIPEINAGEGISLRPVSRVFTVGDDGEEEGEYDPHYWLSVKNGKTMAENIAKELSRLDPVNERLYAENLSGFISRADAADAEIREILSGVENKKIITFHDSWEYFAADYGLEVAAVYQSSPGKEPSPQDVKQLLDKASENGIKVFFSDISASSAPLKAIGEEEGIAVVPLNPLETRGDYLETLVRNAKTIRDALR